MRFTKIIATLGPATGTPEKIEELARRGVNVCRLNFSHGDYAAHGKMIEYIRAVNAKGYSLGIMLDTQGPEVRTGDVKEPLIIKKGDKVLFTSKPTGKETMKTVRVDYDKFADDVEHANSILIDNGAIEFRFITFAQRNVIAEALEDGKIGSRRHVNLPGARLSLPSFTQKDWKDIAFGVEQGVDFFALSFVRTGKDMEELRKFLRDRKSDAEIIAKIETPQAVTNIDEIISASNGIMVARGDLGAEVPFEEVPRIQEEIVMKCRRAGKTVIVATHMLESMILSPMPSRAEVTDIAYACKLQTDSTMLSGETASGMYPFKSVEAMDRVIRANERIEPTFGVLSEAASTEEIDIPRREQALAASVLAMKLCADALFVISKHGHTARAVSNCRPLVPIHAFTSSESTVRRLMLVWGIIPHCVAFSETPEVTIKRTLELVSKKKLLKKGQRVVIVSDMRSVKKKDRIMTIQIRTISH